MTKSKCLTILFIFLLIVLVLPINKVNASTTYDFESDGIGAVPAGWVDPSSAACSARVSNDVAHGGTKSVKIIDGNNNGWGILDIAAQFDETEMTYWIYMFDTNRILATYTYEAFPTTDILAIVTFSNNGKVYVNDGVVATVVLDPYVKEQWYKVKIVHNFVGNTYDVFIDDTLEADDFDFFSGAATNFRSCRFITGKTINLGTMGYIDDVTIGEITYPPPADPDLFFGAGFNDSSPYVELHWNHSLLDVQFFEVQNSSDKVSWDYLGNSTTTNYTDTQVFNGTARFYRVRAVNFTEGSWWNSSFSDVNFETVYFERFIANETIVINNVTGEWIYYNLTSIAVNIGTHDAGNLASTFVVDGNTYDVSEIVGAPGFDIRFNWTNVDQNANSMWIVIYSFYSGNQAHDIDLQLYNFTSTSWTDIEHIEDMIGFEWTNASIYDLRIPNDFINSTGAVWGRIFHADAGNMNHDILIDLIRLHTFIPFEQECPPTPTPTNGAADTTWIIFLAIGLIFMLSIAFLYSKNK